MFRIITTLTFVFWCVAGHAGPLKIFVDADYSISSEAAESIELGVRTALNAANFSDRVLVVPKDHRGNVKRSKRHLDEYLEDDDVIAIIGGLHSPPYLTHRDFINDNQILTLLPWSAAGPITRPRLGAENWIFRLSVDDSKAGGFLAEKVAKSGECERVALLLINTGWGRANSTTLTDGLTKFGIPPILVEFFDGSLGRASALTLARKLQTAQADCAVMLSDWDNGGHIANAIADLPISIRLFSHWGIMGGPFAQVVPHPKRQKLRLQVLQTCALKKEAEGNPQLVQALAYAEGDPSGLMDIPAPTGFVHGYDLTKVLIAAIRQAESSPDWGNGVLQQRQELRNALERLASPIDGILARYDPPFVPYHANAPDAHEALGAQDLCMARFRVDGLLAHAGEITHD